MIVKMYFSLKNILPFEKQKVGQAHFNQKTVFTQNQRYHIFIKYARIKISPKSKIKCKLLSREGVWPELT